MSSLGWTQGLIGRRGQKQPTTDVDVAANVDVAVDVAAAEKKRKKEWIKKCKEERKKEWMATRAKTRAENKQKRAKESTSVLAPVSTHALLLAPPLEPLLALPLVPAEAPATTGLELLANLASNRESTVLLEQTRAQTPPVVFVPLDTPCDLAQSPGLHITWKGWNNGGYIPSCIM